MEEQKKYTSTVVRQVRRRSTVNLYLTLGAAVIAAVGSLLSVNVFFNLSPTGLSINGSSLYSPEQILQVGGLVPGQNLIRLNTDFIEKRLKDNLVYIDSVEVIKDYPDGLVINIAEAKRKAQIEYEGGYCTVSSSGRLLDIQNHERDKLLPVIVGYELVGLDNTDAEPDEETGEYPKLPITAGTEAVSSDEQKAVIIKDLFDVLDSLNFRKIAKIDITDRTNIKLIYDGRIQIELGSAVDLDIKLRYIQAVIETQLPQTYEGTVWFNPSDKSVSTLPKKTDIPQTASTESRSDNSSAADSSTPDQAADGTQTWDQYNYNNDGGYTDYGWGEQTYDGGYTDYGYGDYNYDDYTDYGGW